MKILLLHLFLLFIFSPSFLHAQSNTTDTTNTTDPTTPTTPDPSPAPQDSQPTNPNKLSLDINDWNSFAKAVDQGAMKGFFTLSQVEEIIDSFRDEFPHLFFPVEVIGKTFEGRDISMHCLTNRSIHFPPIFNLNMVQDGRNSTIEEEAETKEIGLITALHHPREPMSLSMIAFFLFRVLVEYHKDEKEYTQLVNNNIICIIPAVNVDGYNYIEEQFNKSQAFVKIRKNRRMPNVRCGKQEDYGVDLNRNYDYCWDCNEDGSSSKPCAEDFRGTAPFSEPETQAIKGFVEKYQNSLKVVVNIHAFGNLWIFPFNCYQDDSSYKTQRIKNIYNDFTQSSHLPKFAKVGNAINTVNYLANGESSDWLLGKHGIIAFSPEIGIHIDEAGKKTETFFPEKKYIFPTVEGDFPPIFYMLSRLNPQIGIESSSEKRLQNRNNRKAIYLNLINRAYSDVNDAEIKVNVNISGIQDAFPGDVLPEFSLIETNENSSSYNSIPFQGNAITVQVVKETNTTVYTVTQPLRLKSWASTQLVSILPFTNYAGVHIELQVNHKDTEVFTYQNDFEGLETITTAKQVSILGIALVVAAVIFIGIVCLTHYYLKEKKAEKSSNMFGRNQAPGLEFAQIGEDESGEYGV